MFNRLIGKRIAVTTAEGERHTGIFDQEREGFIGLDSSGEDGDVGYVFLRKDFISLVWVFDKK